MIWPCLRVAVRARGQCISACSLDITRGRACACVRVQACDAREDLRGALAAYVKATGKRLVTDADKDGEMVTQLLELKARMDDVLRDAFAGSESFTNALKDAFETFINERANRPAELVAKYIDALLKAGNKGTSEEELETLLDRVLILFRYISGKDVFEAFYKKDLAKRLLLGACAGANTRGAA